MHTFKVVRYKKNDVTFNAAVPHQWESNNILRWPAHLTNSEIDALRSSVASMPESNWVDYSCTVKALNLSNFKEALQLEKILNFIAVEIVGSSKDDEQEAQLKKSLVFIKENLEDVLKRVIEVKQEIDKMKVGNIKLMSDLKKLSALLVRHRNQSANAPISHKNVSVRGNRLQNFTFPLKTCDEVTRLENEIRSNPEFKKQLIREMSKIAGTSGQENGTKVAYKVIDWVFRSDLLTLYSWTGVSRGSDLRKKPFNVFEGLLSVFFEVLYLADNRHTKKKNEDIFKEGALKHSKKRNLRKRPRSLDSDFRLENNSDTEHCVITGKLVQYSITDLTTNEEIKKEEDSD